MRIQDKSTELGPNILLDDVRRLDEQGRTDDALDLLFDGIDEMMWQTQFGKLDVLIAGISASNYSLDLLLGILTATLPAKGRLPSRASFVDDVRATLRGRGELEDGLLTGLE